MDNRWENISRDGVAALAEAGLKDAHVQVPPPGRVFDIVDELSIRQLLLKSVYRNSVAARATEDESEDLDQ